MPATTIDGFPRHYHDNENSDLESQASASVMSVDDTAARPKPKWYRRAGPRSCNPIGRLRMLKTWVWAHPDPAKRAKRRKLFQWMLILFAILAFFGVAAGIIYVSFVAALIHRLNPPRVNSGLQHIVDNWKEPTSEGMYKFDWRDDFSRDIVPKNCHSHNDYWRSVPTYEALAAGCVSIEADIWLYGNNDLDLVVGHSWRSTTPERNLKNLYLDPLKNIFVNRNVSLASTEEKEVGVFDTDPNTSVILLIDFKSDGHKTWPVLMKQLKPLHEQGWLTHFDGTQVVQGPLTIVGTGNTPFDLVRETNDDRIIFFDAPLDDISNPQYTAENSLYASVQLRKAIGRLWFNKLNSGQINTLKEQIKAASDKGLKSRYWDTPSWPISLRDKVWFTLTDNEVGMLSVDDLISATRWNWNWCIIAGINLCGNS